MGHVLSASLYFPRWSFAVSFRCIIEEIILEFSKDTSILRYPTVLVVIDVNCMWIVNLMMAHCEWTWSWCESACYFDFLGRNEG